MIYVRFDTCHEIRYNVFQTEFNIAVDPDALHILLQSPTVPVVLAPLNVTHQAIFGDEVGVRLLDPYVPILLSYSYLGRVEV